MRFAVLGAGAIGAYAGAALARGGSEVVLIARGAHLDAMRKDGVRVLSSRGDFAARPEATDDLAAVSGADCVLVGLKAYSLPGILPQVAPLLSPGTVLLPAQNGVPWWFFQRFDGPLAGSVVEAVDPGGVISAAIAPERIVGCVSYPAAEIVAPGVIRHFEGTRFAIGELDGDVTERIGAISEAFQAGGLKAPVESRIRGQLWLKLVGNVAFNPVTALTGATLGEVGELPEMVAIVRTVMEEVAAVGAALGIELPVSIERRLEAGFAVGDHRTSMLQDFDAGKPLELDCMTGAVLEIAAKLGVAVPHTETVHAATKLRERLRRTG
ncbi:MAG: 2-dehydropantoate 2-reductase [Gaiellales bacterium]